MHKTIKNREAVKSWFERSNFYEGASDIIGEKVSEITTKNAGIILKNDPEVKTIIKNSFSAKMVRTNVETFINAVFAWLDGASSQLSFSVDLRSAQQQIADGLSSYTVTRMNSLPLCDSSVPTENFDVFSASCRPAALIPSEAGRLVKDSIMGQDFLQNAVYTSQDLTITNADGTKVPFAQSDAAKGIKAAYGASSSLMIVFSIVSILCAAGIIFFSSTKRRGLLWTGLVCIANGLSLLFFYYIAGAVMDGVRSSLVTDSSIPATTTIIVDFIRAITSDVRSAMSGYILALNGIGAALVASYFLSRSGKSTKETGIDPEPAAPVTETAKSETLDKKEKDSL